MRCHSSLAQENHLVRLDKSTDLRNDRSETINVTSHLINKRN